MCRQNHIAGNRAPTAAGPDCDTECRPGFGTSHFCTTAQCPSLAAPGTPSMLSPSVLTAPPLSSPILTHPTHRLPNSAMHGTGAAPLPIDSDAARRSMQLAGLHTTALARAQACSRAAHAITVHCSCTVTTSPIPDPDVYPTR